jgi:hypothetical protein
MTFHPTGPSFAVLCLAAMLVVTACAKETPEKTTPAPTAFSVTGVELGRGIGGDKRVAEKTATFRPNDVIYASVLTTGATATATLKARWTYEDGQVVDETEQTIAPTHDAATEFHISKPDGWPTGKYRLEVFLNGASVKTHDLEVK